MMLYRVFTDLEKFWLRPGPEHRSLCSTEAPYAA